MSKQRRNNATPSSHHTQPAHQPAAAVPASTATRSPWPGARLPWTYLLTFVLFWVFCTFVYGDVFERTAQANFITTDDTAMSFLTRQPFGRLYCLGRWGLLVFSNVYVGCFVLSLVFTLTTVLADRLLGLGARLRGASALLPGAVLGWMLWRGTNLYYKAEPSLVVLVPLGLLAVVLIGLALRRLVRGRRSAAGAGDAPAGRPWGWTVPVIVFAALTFSARHWNENDILTARMQNRVLRADWEGIIDDALSARRPSRAVAAYYAIALVQTNRLLDRIYELPFDFPTVRLDRRDGNEEYGIFLADANFYTGLANIGYRCAMDYVVMNGPNLYYLKRMAICAIVNNETALARKYLDIIGHVPFEQDFVEKYSAMLADRTLVEQDPELANVIALAPMEQHFEQNYKSPAFLGYNAGLTQGSKPALETALAATLYSKYLPNIVPFVQVYLKNNGGRLPVCVQQALLLLGNSHPDVRQAFAEVINSQQGIYNAFITAATPLINERNRLSAGKSKAEVERIKQEFNLKLRETLRKDWLGTYFYYYYCENNNPDQVSRTTKSEVN